MFEIIGYEYIDFTDKESGEVISGYRIKVMFDSVKDSQKGKCIGSRFIRSKYIQGKVEVGAICEPIFTFNEKLEASFIGIKVI